MNNCVHCGLLIDGEPKVYDKKILPGVPADAGIPQIKPVRLHPKCFPVWYKETYRMLAELDEPLNDCKQFQRDGKTQYGRLVKTTGEAWPELLWQARTIAELKTAVPGFSEWWGAERWLSRWEVAT